MPLLPGHGTRWQDMQITGWQDWYAEVDRELRALSARCSQVFVCGLSMGGAPGPAAGRRGTATRSAGSCWSTRRSSRTARQLKAVPVLRHLVPSVPGIASDIAKEGRPEVGYDRTPLHAVHSLTPVLAASCRPDCRR